MEPYIEMLQTPELSVHCHRTADRRARQYLLTAVPSTETLLISEMSQHYRLTKAEKFLHTPVVVPSIETRRMPETWQRYLIRAAQDLILDQAQHLMVVVAPYIETRQTDT